MDVGTLARWRPVISTESRQHDRPRLLIIDPDAATVNHLLDVFERACWNPRSAKGSAERPRGIPLRCDCANPNPNDACVIVVDSLAGLHVLDLAHVDAVICATSLGDASGLDALAYVQGTAPELPVIIIGGDGAMAVEAIRGGALDFVLIGGEEDLLRLPLAVEKCRIHQRIKQENERLHRDLKSSLAELAVTNHQLQDVIRQLETMARTDELTGLANRRWFNLMLHGSWAEATRHDLPLACLMIDMDGFKSVNDRLGHHEGDELLRLAGKVLRANCREVDVPARYGGDEFCVLMAHTEPNEAIVVAERIRTEFEIAMKARTSGERNVGMSIGMSHVNLSRPVNADQLVTHADQAMYAAKATGKHRVMVREREGMRAAVV